MIGDPPPQQRVGLCCTPEPTISLLAKGTQNRLIHRIVTDAQRAFNDQDWQAVEGLVADKSTILGKDFDKQEGTIRPFLVTEYSRYRFHFWRFIDCGVVRPAEKASAGDGGDEAHGVEVTCNLIQSFSPRSERELQLSAAESNQHCIGKAPPEGCIKYGYSTVLFRYDGAPPYKLFVFADFKPKNDSWSPRLRP
jgi:hypothetical protein